MNSRTVISVTKRRSRSGQSFWALFEYWWPWGFGLLAGLALFIFNPSTSRTAVALDRAVNGGLGAASILAGFQVTALTLMLSIADKPIVKQLRRLGFYDRLIAYHGHAILLLLGWLVLSLVLIVVQGGTLDAQGKIADQGAWTRWSAIGIAVLASGAVAACFRVTLLTIKLLRSTAADSES